MTWSFQRSALSALVLLTVSLHAKANLVHEPIEDEADETITAQLETSKGKKGIAVGYQYGFVEYNEPGLMKEYGSLHGIHASYDFMLTDKFIRLESDFSAGSLTYDGHYQDGTPTTTTTKDSIFNLRGMGVWTHHFTVTTMLNWYGGLGLRYLNDKIVGRGGYEREISYLYFPVGVTLTQQLNSGWSISGNFEYDIFFAGRVKSHLSDVNPSNSDIENTQTSGFGTRASLNVRKDFQTYAVKVQPYFQYWHIKDSNFVPVVDENGQRGYLYEPENSSKMLGLNVIAEI